MTDHPAASPGRLGDHLFSTAGTPHPDPAQQRCAICLERMVTPPHLRAIAQSATRRHQPSIALYAEYLMGAAAELDDAHAYASKVEAAYGRCEHDLRDAQATVRAQAEAFAADRQRAEPEKPTEPGIWDMLRARVREAVSEAGQAEAEVIEAADTLIGDVGRPRLSLIGLRGSRLELAVLKLRAVRNG